MQEPLKAMQEATAALDEAVGAHMLPIITDHEQLTIYMDEHKGDYNTVQIQAFQKSLWQIISFMEALEDQLRFSLLLSYQEYMAIVKYGAHILQEASKNQGLLVDKKLCARATKLADKFPLSRISEEFAAADADCGNELSKTIVKRYKAMSDIGVK